jgi:hypothetical protein
VGHTGFLVTENSILPHCSCAVCGGLIRQLTRAVHTVPQRYSILLNVRQRQTKFWLRTGLHELFPFPATATKRATYFIDFIAPAMNSV